MKQSIVSKIEEVLKSLQAEGILPAFALPEVHVEVPKDEQFGEYTSNIALVMSKAAGKNPREVATFLQEKLGDDFAKVEVAGPGHLNFFLKESDFAHVVTEVLEKQEHFADSTFGQGVKVNNEFISANPTGPLHLGNGRGGFYGDSLSRLLRKTGFEVTNEYYINDAGEQVTKLGHSVLQDEEAVYGGEYIEELRAKLGELENDAWEVGKRAAELVVSDYIKPTIESGMQISFDKWTSERALVEGGMVERAIEKLKEQGRVFENEGATWLRTTDFGDDKDRVLIKADGTKTYFASECGYILSKLEQGYEMIIEIWGADHHGYTNRFNAVVKAFGKEEGATFLLMQLVKLVKNGEEVRMSKRAGNVVTMDELIELVGHDVTRFFFLQYSPDTHMTFDLGLAEERSQKNPVFYVQYAHARMASILEKGQEVGMDMADVNLSLLVHGKEKSLMREMLTFQEFLESAARDSAPHRLPQLAIRLADKFHSYYAECQVIDIENKELSQARVALVSATKIVLGETLRLIGVSAPEKM
ncbi:MAG: arginine--tRNA ligase [Candidatus Moranbacteria bacterium]|nr:arginine--tRNA ligase [Candidatus Moranbacteria bacterium]